MKLITKKINGNRKKFLRHKKVKIVQMTKNIAIPNKDFKEKIIHAEVFF